MPFQYVLANLLAESPDAVGVLFLDDSGETVDLACSEYPPFEMQVVGAHLGIHLRQLAAIVENVAIGKMRLFHIERERLHFHVVMLPDGYYLALVQRCPTLVAQARRRLRRAAEQLRREIFQS